MIVLLSNNLVDYELMSLNYFVNLICLLRKDPGDEEAKKEASETQSHDPKDCFSLISGDDLISNADHTN